MRRAVLVAAALASCALALAQSSVTSRPELAAFIANMVERHGMDAAALRELLEPLKPVPAIVKAVSAPSTSRPWREYRPMNVDKGRIEGGVRFWNAHEPALARARQSYGVPESIIVAILGVETRFGRITGTHRVLDALYTLGFEVPGRNEYFKSELENFLLLTRDWGWDPASLRGSFAGAMGMPQFMPASYRRYAVDFDDNGSVDLWNDVADVVGSVAHFLKTFGWREGEPIAMPAMYEGSELEPLLAQGIRPHTPLRELRARGVVIHGEADGDLASALFMLDGDLGPEYWLAFDNLNAILMYNRSRNYAMSVYLLALEIARERERLNAVEQARGASGEGAANGGAAEPPSVQPSPQPR